MDERRWDLFCWLATCYRAVLLRRVEFIGITGSGGKTTTKELTTTVLSSRLRGEKSLNNRNISLDVARTIFQVRPWDRFCVQELSVGSTLEHAIRMVRPRIAVVTNIGTDHLSEYGTQENIAEAKGKLVAALPSDGTAVLNADDRLVMGMGKRCRARIITFGVAPEATVRAGDISSSWPDRLSLTVHYGGQSRRVQTMLCGTHWTHAVLAAIAVGIAMGLTFDQAVGAAQMLPPFRLRLSPVGHPDGVTFIRDDYKAPLSTVAPALDFLRNARATRKIAVVGTLSDYRGDASAQYVKVARQALEAADCVFFVGRWASRVLRAKRHPDDDAVRAFSNVDELAAFLPSFLEPGDLVLLKGRLRLDRLEKVINACLATAVVARAPQAISSAPVTAGAELARRMPRQSPAAMPTTAMEPTVQVVVGLGNPEERCRDTRHNVGHRVVDLVAQTLGAQWHEDGLAALAHIDQHGKTIYLLKPLTRVNDTGQALVQLAHRLGFGPRQCLLVHDDLDLAVGGVRMRAKGSAGGHNGVRSIIDAFQSEDFPRIKIGIGRPGNREQIAQYVLEEFTEAERPKIEQALAQASSRVLEYADLSPDAVTVQQTTDRPIGASGQSRRPNHTH